ncbi:restriction endonuclease subunit S [Paenibacillus glufosinatiresistens]|uniref:restriction endonuclease subunit S n=1 Tax=Paenibacillus glufosinatiresistens TaxID=3070657 RepID=UPI00286EA8ED|nr:restriction endonuclease subunit S [Paenibacillus sp. YX.27]
MSREQAYLRMLESTAAIQGNIALILEAKAAEAEKVRHWANHHIHSSAFDTHEEQLKESLSFHEAIVEMVESLTKLENGLCSNLKAVLDTGGEDGGEEGMGGGFGGMDGGFDFGNTDK